MFLYGSVKLECAMHSGPVRNKNGRELDTHSRSHLTHVSVSQTQVKNYNHESRTNENIDEPDEGVNEIYSSRCCQRSDGN